VVTGADGRSGGADPGARPPRPRRPRRVFGVGQEPDARFTLANERTVLAWVRTSLAFVVAGLAAAVADRVVDTGNLLRVVAVSTVAVAAWLAVSSLLRWARTERAMRLQEPLPAPSALVVVVAAVLALAGVALVAVLGADL
jgi:putative membrane protein